MKNLKRQKVSATKNGGEKCNIEAETTLTLVQNHVKVILKT